jgi:predicted house-cleaning noncanonical NTP pyrophosphatase (MazG superfamily)
MSKKFESLDNMFDVTPKVIEHEIISDTENKENINTDDIIKDYEYTRGNLYSIIEKGQEAINGILELAQESEMPRAYEVAGQLIKNVSDATEKLMDLQKKMKDINSDTSQKTTTNVTNALFVGSTSELSKLLKSQKFDSDQK